MGQRDETAVCLDASVPTDADPLAVTASPDHATFPQKCPDCAGLYGMPHMVATMVAKGAISVGISCQGCGHEWLLQVPVTIDQFYG